MARVLRTLAVRAAPYAAVLLAVTALVLTAARLVIGSLPERREQVAGWLAAEMGHRVSIGTLGVRWRGWTPEITLTDVEILDPTGEAAARLDHLALAIDPLASLTSGAPALAGVRVEGAGLSVVRETDGTIALRGLAGGGDHGDLAALLLAAPAPVELRGSEVQWEDRTRGLAPVKLSDVNVHLRNVGERHVIEASARIPGGQARYLLDARGDLLIGAWSGFGFLEVRGLSLGRWVGRAWPGHLAAHSGAADLTAWVEWADGRARRVVGRMAARNASLEIGPDAVNLSEARVGFQGLRVEPGWHVALSDLSLRSDQGAIEAAAVEIRLPGRRTAWPVIAHVPSLRLIPASGRPAQNGAGGAGPLGGILRAAPSGTIQDLWAAYGGQADASPSLRLSAGLEGFGLRSPAAGVRGLSGRVWVHGLDGHLALDAGPVTADLPQIFSEPLVLGKLTGRLVWRVEDDRWVVSTPSLVVENPDLKLEVTGQLAQTPTPAASPYLSLRGQLNGLDLTTLPRYLPRRAL